MMGALYTLLAPGLWSIKNDIVRFNRAFYRKAVLYGGLGALFLFLVTDFLTKGLMKLQGMSAEASSIILMKGYSLVFIVLFFMQILNGIVLSLNTLYQSKEMEVLLVSPVERTSLFFSRLIETQIKTSWMLIVFGAPLIIASGIIYHAPLFYYAYALLLFLAYSALAVNIGAALTICLASIFYVRKLRKFLLSAGVLLAVFLVTVLRMIRPEQYANPELFANLTLFIAEMKASSFVLLPGRWLSDAMFGVLTKNFDGATVIFASLLFLTAYVSTVGLLIVFIRYHYKGWRLLQETGTLSVRNKPAASRTTVFLADKLGRVAGTQGGMLMKKDLLYQVRDMKNINQMLILFSLIVIYLFSIMSLPLNWEYYSVQLRYIISFFNLGIILIIIASLCARLVYPQVVADGGSFWILKTSPLMPGKYVLSKFFFFFIPVLITGELLIALSSHFIGIERMFLFLNMATIALTTLSLVSMSVVFGIHDMKTAVNDAPQETTRSGNIVHMLLSVFLVAIILLLEVVPVFLYFLKEAQQGRFSIQAWMILGGVMVVVLLVNLTITLVSIRLGIRKVERLELA